MSDLSILSLSAFVVLVLDVIWRSLRKDIRSSAKTFQNPSDSSGKIYQFGTSNLTSDIPVLTFFMIAIASFALSTAILFCLDLPEDPAEVLLFANPELFWARTCALSVLIVSILVVWYRLKMRAYRKSLGKEIVTSSTGVQFSLFMDMQWHRAFLKILRGEAYVGFRWDKVSEWRVVRTWYPSSNGGTWVQEYRIEVEDGFYVLSRDSLLGLEELFLNEVRDRIGDRLKIEDALVTQ